MTECSEKFCRSVGNEGNCDECVENKLQSVKATNENGAYLATAASKLKSTAPTRGQYMCRTVDVEAAASQMRDSSRYLDAVGF